MKNNQRIQEMPADSRPYEKCLAQGPESLSDRELLAVILRSGTKEFSCLELAGQILTAGKTEQGLLGIHHLSLRELLEIKGIGTVKAVQIKCIGELSKRMAAVAARKLLDFQNPDTIAAYYMEQLRHEKQEQMICMMLNNHNQLMGEKVISKGTVNTSLVSPRDVVLAALDHRAVYVILVHNHPSGDPTPSQEDLLLTRRMWEVCRLVDIPLLDHIVIGDQRYISFKQEGIIN